MTDRETRDDEALFDGWARMGSDAFDSVAVSADLKELLLRRTTGVVRRRRRGRRLVLASSIVLVFLAGAAAGRFAFRPSPLRESDAARSPTSADPAIGMLPADPSMLLARVESAPRTERTRLLREAGDGYLAPDRADPAAALECYRRLLDEPYADDPDSPAGRDSWLLSYLKLARP